ncbi:MAG: alpha-L-fucosidase [Acidobacteriota bacterium]|nr:MAG: alpha-L-fucosidase [Acidobacteriota bacterium]
MELVRSIAVVLTLVSAPALSLAQQVDSVSLQGNRAERLEWFQDQGLGLFIHWSLDSQIGSVISHSLVGASEDYVERFFKELPKTFEPTRFDPQEWARLARVTGFKYVVFTTKHHSGFSMFDTAVNEFDIMNTPYGRDLTAEIVEAFRREGLAIGFYFSPDDFFFLHEQGTLISRRRPEVQPINNPGLMAHNKQQVRELLTKYGDIDVMFFDGPADGLLELGWELEPDLVVTRGAMQTPEIAPSTTQGIPDLISVEPWEACFTMGTSWQFKPTNEQYLPGRRWIEMLVETRAKGGNMLLNIGPRPDGEIPSEQEDILREIGLWMFVNREAIYGVRPWVTTHEGDVWFTRKKDASTVYAAVMGDPWPWGEERTVILKSVRATDSTEVIVLGQNDQVLEYNPDIIPQTIWEQTDEGLRVTAIRAQRLYNDRTWPNPIVLKITNAEAAASN